MLFSAGHGIQPDQVLLDRPNKVFYMGEVSCWIGLGKAFASTGGSRDLISDLHSQANALENFRRFCTCEC